MIQRLLLWINSYLHEIIIYLVSNSINHYWNYEPHFHWILGYFHLRNMKYHYFESTLTYMKLSFIISSNSINHYGIMNHFSLDTRIFSFEILKYKTASNLLYIKLAFIVSSYLLLLELCCTLTGILGYFHFWEYWNTKLHRIYSNLHEISFIISTNIIYH
jgi:hypothetical protein